MSTSVVELKWIRQSSSSATPVPLTVQAATVKNDLASTIAVEKLVTPFAVVLPCWTVHPLAAVNSITCQVISMLDPPLWLRINSMPDPSAASRQAHRHRWGRSLSAYDWETITNAFPTVTLAAKLIVCVVPEKVAVPLSTWSISVATDDLLKQDFYYTGFWSRVCNFSGAWVDRDQSAAATAGVLDADA
jgi:hypothetical protein